MVVLGGEAVVSALLPLSVGIRLADKLFLKQDHAGLTATWFREAQHPIITIICSFRSPIPNFSSIFFKFDEYCGGLPLGGDFMIDWKERSGENL